MVQLSTVPSRLKRVDLENSNCERQFYDPMIAYARSKTANILFAVQFDRRHRAQSASDSVAPGVIKSKLEHRMSPEEWDKAVE
jgi:hypothetical protein